MRIIAAVLMGVLAASNVMTEETQPNKIPFTNVRIFDGTHEKLVDGNVHYVMKDGTVYKNELK